MPAGDGLPFRKTIRRRNPQWVVECASKRLRNEDVVWWEVQTQ